MSSKSESKKSSKEPTIKANITGPVSGQVAIGENITQTKHIRIESTTITEADIKTLRDMIANLESQIEASVPTDMQEKALEKVSELEEAITAKEPDITTMEYIKNWFGKNLPQLAGAVTGLIVNPIVGKLVEVAGDTLASEFRRRFGHT